MHLFVTVHMLFSTPNILLCKNRFSHASFKDGSEAYKLLAKNFGKHHPTTHVKNANLNVCNHFLLFKTKRWKETAREILILKGLSGKGW
jgi:hypothetical protein